MKLISPKESERMFKVKESEEKLKREKYEKNLIIRLKKNLNNWIKNSVDCGNWNINITREVGKAGCWSVTYSIDLIVDEIAKEFISNGYNVIRVNDKNSNFDGEVMVLLKKTDRRGWNYKYEAKDDKR